jgi:hypothetical protein
MLTDIVVAMGAVDVCYQDTSVITSLDIAPKLWEHFLEEECTPEFCKRARKALPGAYTKEYSVISI